MKKSLEKRGTRGGIRNSGGVRALLLLASDLVPASLSCFLGMSTRELMQGLRQAVQDPWAIAMKGLNMILLNGLADPLGMELLEL